MTSRVLIGPYLLFLGDAPNLLAAKTGSGLAYWRPHHCLAQYRLPGAQADLGLPDMDIAAAVAAGAKTMVVGIAPIGGVLPDDWVQCCVAAIEAGMDVAAGLHFRLADVPAIADAAVRHARAIHDVRVPPDGLPCGTGVRRGGNRLLTVGTDCCVGKMYSALAIHREMQSRGINATFRATGQTGILIEGTGISVDAVVSDFISGAIEVLAPANDPDHWDVIEGQGSIFHPAYAGVSLGLLHGSQPDVIVVCHEAGRERIDEFEDFAIQPLQRVIDVHLDLARLTNPDVRFGGVSLNTRLLNDTEAVAAITALSEQLDAPVVDPVRTGMAPIVDGLEEPCFDQSAA